MRLLLRPLMWLLGGIAVSCVLFGTGWVYAHVILDWSPPVAHPDALPMALYGTFVLSAAGCAGLCISKPWGTK